MKDNISMLSEMGLTKLSENEFLIKNRDKWTIWREFNPMPAISVIGILFDGGDISGILNFITEYRLTEVRIGNKENYEKWQELGSEIPAIAMPFYQESIFVPILKKPTGKREKYEKD